MVLIAILTSLSWLRIVIEEVRQLKDNLEIYFTSIWNYFDMVHLTLTMVILSFNSVGSEAIAVEDQRAMAAIIVFFLMLKAYDWFRLFQSTAFYIMLIQETILETGFFIILFMMALVMFGLPTLFLNFNREQDSSLICSITGNPIIDSVLCQYLQQFNGVETDVYANKPQASFCVLLFLFGTMFTNLIMLNMLIAIMADTFERITENRAVFATMTKLSLLGDFAPNLN